MIPFEFEYYRPDTVFEAVDAFLKLDEAGKCPVYYGGGSELISMARVGNASFGAVIDIKEIPECRVFAYDRDNLLLGSALTLSDITESNQFPLLTKTAGRIADHTMQCKITLGGNLASAIIYRETVLPLLVADAHLTIAGPGGLKDRPISHVFCERLRLEKGELILHASIKKNDLQAPYFHIKKTKNEKIDYPLFTTAGLKKNGQLRVAFSGLASYPFRNMDTESILNDTGLSFPERAEQIAAILSPVVLNDLSGSAPYRLFVLKNTIEKVLETMKGR